MKIVKSNYKIYVCDRCGKEYRESAFLKTITIIRYKVKGNGDDTHQNVELCARCKCFFDHTVEGFLKVEHDSSETIL